MTENEQDDDSIMRMTRQSDGNFQDAETPSSLNSQPFRQMRNNGPRLNRQSTPDDENDDSDEGDELFDDRVNDTVLMGEEDLTDMNTQFEMMNIHLQNQGHPPM